MEIYKEFFSEIECYKIILKYSKKLTSSYIGNYEINQSIRKSNSYLFRDEVIESKFHNPNNLLFQLQITEYNVGDHYTWHRDSLNRLETYVVILNTEFEGGYLQLKEDENISLDIGDCLKLEKNILHRVTPITKGIRYSLVVWLSKEFNV